MASGTIKSVVPRSDIVNNLTTNDSTKVLSAAQGKVLNEQIGTVAEQLGTITSFTESVTIDEVTYFVMGVQYTAFNGRIFKIGISLATATSNRLFVYNGFLAKWETVTLTSIS